MQAPRGDIVDRNGNVLVENRAATVVQLDPESLPAAERNAAATWGQHVTARSRRPKGQKGPLVPIPPPATPHLETRFKRLARVLDMSPKTIQERVVQSLASLPYANVTVKVDVDVPRAQLPGRAPRGLPRHRRRAQVPAPLPAALAGGPARGQHRRDRRLRAQAQALQGRHAGHGGRPGRPRARLRPVPARRRRLDQDHHRRARAAQELGAGPRPGARALGAHDARPRPAADRREVPRPDDQPGPRHAPAASSRSTRATAACSRSAPIPTVNPSILSKPFSQATADRLFGDSGGAPLFNRAIGGSYPTGSTFKPITALAAHEQRRRAAERRHRRQRLHQDRHREPGGRATPARRRSAR